jgi:arylsulfatase A-like enzyme
VRLVCAQICGDYTLAHGIEHIDRNIRRAAELQSITMQTLRIITSACLFSILVAGNCAMPKAQAASDQKRLNIVYMYADDWRWDCIGVEQKERGDKGRFPWLETPRLDKLAREGVRFRNSFVVNSLCSPGRACVLTSRYSHLNGIIGNSKPMSPDTPTLGAQMKKAGYSTAYCGKFHMDSQRERPGFDYVASFIGQGKYNDCPILLNGKQTPTHGWIDDISTDYAIKFLQKQTNDKPFFLWLGFKSPHDPRGGENLPERDRELYEGKESRPVPNMSVPAIFKEVQPNPGRSARRPGGPFEAHRAYMRHITAIDQCVGRVLDGLESTGHMDDTIVIVTSDNGYYLGEHELGDKRSAYDESMRVPLLVRLPGKTAKRGITSDAMVLNIDYAPTILDFAVADPLPDAQGRSLRPLLNGERPDDWRKAFFYEYFKEPNFTSPTVLAIRTDTQKLITYPGHDEWTEAFDLVNDPYEMKNLVADKSLMKELRSQFDAEAKAVKFQMPKIPEAAEKPPANAKRKNRPADADTGG